MRRSTRVTSRKSRLLALSAAAVSQAMLASFRVNMALGAPQGAQVVRGKVTITESGDVMTIHASNNSIINFASFDIAAGETVDIIEPSRRSRVLERVFGTSQTVIDGDLISNGRLTLVNPNGISFGAGASVNVAGITAVAGALSNGAFVKGGNHFTQLSGSVVNNGKIVSSGPTALVGATVQNAGSIAAGKSTVVLAAGGNVFIGTHGSDVYATVTPAADSLAANVEGSGDIYSLALARTSQISASQIVADGGGGNVQISGSMNVSSARSAGGSVNVTSGGGNVELSGASINVSGATGGGAVNIGGDLHGAGPLAAAGNTLVSSDSTINADATKSGNGGQVVVWSGGQTIVGGTITARGAGAGNGGLIETSGHDLETSGATIIASSPGGLPGTWLMDPTDVNITTNPTTSGTSVVAGTNTFSPGSGGGNVDVTDIETSLDAGTDVVINTTGSGTDAGNITVATPISAALTTGAVSLTFDADPSTGSIFVNSAISASGAALTINFHGGVATNIGAAISTNGGSLTSDAPTFSHTAGAIAVGVGNISISADSMTFGAGTGSITGTGTVSLQLQTDTAVQFGGTAGAGTLLLTQADIDAFANGFTKITLAAGSAPVTFASTGTTFGLSNPLSVTTTGGITISQDIDAESSHADALILNGGPASEIDIENNITTDGGNLGLTAGTVNQGSGFLISTGAGTINIQTDTLTLGGGVGTISGVGGITILPLSDTAVQLGGTAGAGTLLISQDDLDVFAPGFSGMTVSAGTAPVTVDAGGINIPNPLSVTTTGGISVLGSINTENGSAEAVSLNGGSGASVILSGSIVTDGGNVTVIGGTITQNNGADINVGAGNVTLQTDDFDLENGVGFITGTGTATLQPLNDTAVQLGGAAPSGTLLISQSVLDTFTPGFADVNVNAGAGAVTVDSGGINIPNPLTVTSTGIVTIFGNIAAENGTAENITFNAPVDIGQNLTLTPGGGSVTFGGTVDSGSGGPFSLAVVTAGTTSFAQTVGGSSVLSSLNTSGGGITVIGGSITTQGAQSYGEAVTLTPLAGTVGFTLTTGTGAITFASTVTGAGTRLIVDGVGGNVFNGSVTVESLDAKGAGGTTLGGATVSTSAGQTYEDAVSLTGSSTSFTDATGAITFESTIMGTSTAVTVNGAGGNFLMGADQLGSLATKGVGGTTLGNTLTGVSISTTGNQTYGDTVTLVGTSAMFVTSTGAITFGSNVAGASTALIVDGFGGNTFDGTVAVSTLTAEGHGTTNLNGATITTAGAQSYADAVTLSGSTVTLSNSTGAITFSSSVTGAGTELTVLGNQGNSFGGEVTALSLTTGGTGLTTIKEGVATTNGQTYENNVMLDDATLMDGTLITFDGSIAGSGTVQSQGSIKTNGGQSFTNPSIQFSSDNPSDAGQFGSNFRLLNGSGNLDTATLIAQEVPFEAPASLGHETLISLSDRADLALLGIYLQSEDQTAADVTGSRTGGFLINDWPQVHHASARDRLVNPDRLSSSGVTRMLKQADAVWGEHGARRRQVTRMLSGALAAYRADNPSSTQVAPGDFVRFVFSKSSQRAVAEKLLSMRRLVDDVGQTGLTPAQAIAANETWTAGLTPTDDKLVDGGGKPDSTWLLDVVDTLLPPR